MLTTPGLQSAPCWAHTQSSREEEPAANLYAGFLTAQTPKASDAMSMAVPPATRYIKDVGSTTLAK